MKKKSKFPIFLIFFALLATNLGNYWYFNVYQENVYQSQAKKYEDILNSHKTQVYTAGTDILAGTKITEDLLVLAEGYISNRRDLFTVNDLGRTAIANISAGSILHKNMVYDETINPGNTAQYSDIKFPSSAVDGNYVDIRIRYPNGSNFVVVSKTRLTGINHENGLSHLTLSESEHQFLSSAFVDKEVFKAEIYATIYISPETQDAALVTYIPRKETLPLIYDNEDSLIQNQKMRDKLERQVGGVIVCE